MSKKRRASGKNERLNKNRLERRSAQKKKTLKAFFVVLAALVLTAALAVGGYFAALGVKNLIDDSGSGLRKKVYYSSEHFKVDGAMLSYCFYDTLLTENVYEDFDIRNPNELKSMYFTDEDGTENPEYTRYRYYAELSASRIRSCMYYAEAALDHGLSLDERDLAFIDAKLSAIENSAALQGKSAKDYLFANYGRGVNLSDVRRVLELRALSDKDMAYVYCGESVSAEEIASYISENDDLRYYCTDYILFGYMYSADREPTAEERARDEEKIRALAACESEEAFLALCRTYIAEEHEGDHNYTDEDLDDDVEACRVDGRALERSTSPVEKWIFDFSRKAGDTYLALGQTSNGAIYMVRPAYSIDLPQKAVRIVKIAYENYARTSEASAAFKAVENAWIGSRMTEEDFISLVRRYSEDLLTAGMDGLEKDTASDTAFNGMISEWLSGAEPGGVASFSDSEGLYLVFCTGAGAVRSEIDAEKAIRGQKYYAAVNGYSSAYKVDVLNDNVSDLPPLKK